MKRRFYAISAVILLGLFGASFIAIKEYNEPSYQVKDYTATLTQMGSAKFSQLYHQMMRQNENGVIDLKEVLAARQAVSNMGSHKNSASELYWRELGPNYVGGRTRALIQDNQPGSEAILYAGSVAGGLFISYNGGEQWYGYSSNLTSLNIGDIGQTSNGTLFVGTGPQHDGGHGNGPSSSNGFEGDGLFRREMDGNGGHTFTRIIGPETNIAWRFVNRIKTSPTDPNKIYVGTGNGLMISANAQATQSEVSFMNPQDISFALTGAVDDIAVSNDGSTIYVAISSRIYKLTDAGGTNVTLAGTIDLPAGQGGVDRIALGLAPSDNNVIYAAVASQNPSPCTYGIFQSKDAGETWKTIGQGGGSFDPYISLACQGGWDNTCAVSPTNSGRLIVGGVNLFEFVESKTAPGTGTWNRIALTTGGGLVDTNYVHADKHRILWIDSATIYIASDGGVGKSLDGGKTWGQNNNGFNVTQFYSISVGFGVRDDSSGITNGEQVMGGTQDNGTQLIGTNPFRPDQAIEVLGGDGFATAFSNMGNIAFGSVYYGAIQRLTFGTGGGSFFDDELQSLCVDDVPANDQGCGPFYTRFAYWETGDAEFTYDSLKYFKSDTLNILAGDTILYQSDLGNVPLFWPAPKDMGKGDSAILPDFAQSKFVFATGTQGLSNRIYMTKDAANLDKIDPEWDLIANLPAGNNVFKMAFSGDGNQLFMGTTGGNVYRVDNLNYGYDSLTLDIRSPQCVLTTTLIAGVNGLSGLSVDPNNPENVVVCAPGYGGTTKIWRIQNAATRTTSGGAVQIQGDFPTGVPIYACLISDHDPNTIIIGTEFGVYATDNGLSPAPNWVQSKGMPIVATYDLVQHTSKYLYGDRVPRVQNIHYRKVYAGTHGRGFWATDGLVGIDDNEPKKKIATKDQQVQFKIYPNPLSTNGFMEIFLPKSERVSVEIFDLNGKLISTIRSGQLVEGKNKLNFDVSSIPSGTYIAALKSSDEMKVSKFVVMK